MKVQAKVITEQECKWHGVALQDVEVAEIRVAAWFLTEKSCGIKNRQYDFEGVKAKKKRHPRKQRKCWFWGSFFHEIKSTSRH